MITPIKSEGIKEKLNASGINQYFELIDCPSEFQREADWECFEHYIKTFSKGGAYGIYGTTFYSLYFYEKMRADGCTNLYLIPEEGADSSARTQKIKELIPDITFMPQDNWNKYIDEIYVTVDIRMECLKIHEETNLPVVDVFDLTHIITEYKNPELAKFRNINEGERCFIIGTGPSLRVSDLDKIRLQGDQSISVNRIYLAFGQTEWRPDYYIVSDVHCIEESENEIKRIDVKNKFVSDRYPAFWNDKVPDNIYKYHCHFSMVNGTLPNYSEELEYCIYGGATVTYEAIQLATFLGFKTIYLLGVDFNFSENYKDAKNHFAPNYYTADSQVSFFLRDQQLNAFCAAKQYADSHGIQIYNATRGGKLEIFERVDFDSLFADQED